MDKISELDPGYTYSQEKEPFYLFDKDNTNILSKCKKYKFLPTAQKETFDLSEKNKILKYYNLYETYERGYRFIWTSLTIDQVTSLLKDIVIEERGKVDPDFMKWIELVTELLGEKPNYIFAQHYLGNLDQYYFHLNFVFLKDEIISVRTSETNVDYNISEKYGVDSRGKPTPEWQKCIATGNTAFTLTSTGFRNTYLESLTK